MPTVIRILAVLLTLALYSGARAEEVWAGVWKLNLDKSPRAPGRPQSQVVILKLENGMALFDEDNITAKGDSYHVSSRIGLDGKDSPVNGSRAGVERISARTPTPDTVEIKIKKKDGTLLGTYWTTHSADGTMRITLFWAGAEIAGPPTRVTIHDRQ